MAITNFQVTANTSTAAFTASADTAVTVIYVTNKSASDGNVNIYVVPSADSVSENFKIYNNVLIPAQDTYIVDTEKLILESGDKIYIEAPDSAAQFNATISTIGL
jgi:hypothetical protein